MQHRNSKRTLSDNEANPPRPTKSSKIDTPISGSNPSTWKNVEGINARPQCTNQGQGGVVYQCAELEKKLRPDLQPQAMKISKTAANIPEGIPANKMAPPAPEKTVKPKRLAPPKVLVMVHKEDPLLGHGAPKPSQHKVTVEGTRFGFQASAAPPERHAPTGLPEHESPENIRATSTHVKKRVAVTYMSGAKKDQDQLPLPSTNRRVNCFPPPTRRSRDTQQEIVPDSEPERTLNNGNDGDNSMSELTGSDTEQTDTNGKDSDASQEEESQGFDLIPDPEALAEMEMDPFAMNEFEDPLGPNHNQDQGAMDIDKDSPDQDDRRALAALQDQDGMDKDEDAPYSVLDAHHNTNWKVRAPDSEDLERARNHQSAAETPSLSKQRHDNKMRLAHEDSDNDNADNEAEEEEEDAVLKKKPVHGPTSSNMQKRTAETLRVAGDFIIERIAAYEDDPRNKEQLDDSYYDLRAMSSLIFEDGASSRGQLKTQCCLFTATHFSELLQPDCPNQLDYAATMQLNATKLCKKGFFLQGGRDENGKTRNFGNSLIATVCRAFYYSKKKTSLNILFPREFDELPWESLAMVCTCIANCIDEYTSGTHVTLKFEGDSYAGVHEATMLLIARADEDEYHGPRFRQMLKDIVRTDRMQSNTPKSTPQNADLNLDLD